MSKIDYSAILGLQVGSAPEPKPLPAGTYHGTIAGLPVPRTVETKEGAKVVLTVPIQLSEPGEDVDQDELTEAGGLNGNDGQGKRVRQEFWLDDSSRYQFDRFLAGLGHNAESGVTYQEILEDLPGQAVTVLLSLDDYKAKSGEDRKINNVKRCYAREA